MDEQLPEEARADDAQAEDVSVARLRAADPAAQAGLTDADLAALRAAVEQRRSAGAGDELAARRARRWTSWPARAAAVAVVALAAGGGGGYAIGAAGGDAGNDTVAESSADAPISLALPEADAASGAADEGASAESAPAQGRDMGGADGFWGGWYGRTVFSSSGLSDAATTGRAWALDAGAVSAEAATAAAAALGVSGDARLEYGSWVVGPNDGSGPTVTLGADGTGSLSYWDPTMDLWWCPTTADTPATDDGAGIDPVAPEPCEQRDLGAAPTGDAAMDVLRERMSALGIDPAGFELVTEDTGDPAYSYVVAHQVVDGQRTGLTWNASLTGAGVSALYGFTAGLVDLGEYDVISPAEAVERLNDPRFGAGYVGPMRAAEGSATVVAPEMEEPDGVPPAPVTPGSAFAWPVQFVTIVEARLGVALVTGADGAAALAPSYELTSADGSVWSVVAVAEDHLEFAAG